MNILILEDDKSRQDKFMQNTVGHIRLIVNTARDCIESLEEAVARLNSIDILFLDHDLGGHIMQASGPGTGYEVAEWLSQHPDRKPKHIIIHSFCIHGAQNMLQVLPEGGYEPGVWLLK